MKVVNKKELLAFKKTLPSVQVEPRKTPKRVKKDSCKVTIDVPCRGGKGCTRGMINEEGLVHYVKFSRRKNVMCTCWRQPKVNN